MAEFTRKSSYSYEDLISCSRSELFGPGKPKLPTPNMLMLDRITEINEGGGAYAKGEAIAELDIKPDLWFFGCHFYQDPVMPGCLGLDALWQMLGFYLGWRGYEGRGRASGCGRVKFTGQILPTNKKVTYHIQLQKIAKMARVVMGVAEGHIYVDDVKVYIAEDLKVALFNKENS